MQLLNETAVTSATKLFLKIDFVSKFKQKGQRKRESELRINTHHMPAKALQVGFANMHKEKYKWCNNSECPVII